MSTRISVTRRLDVKRGRVFDLLATPHQHHLADASGSVLKDEDDEPITKVGQVFRMNMRRVSTDGSEYQTDNHVSQFEPSSLIAWQPGPVSAGPLGWEWCYELEKVAKGRTEVRLTYDWSKASPETVAKYGVPRFTKKDLEASLAALAKAFQD